MNTSGTLPFAVSLPDQTARPAILARWREPLAGILIVIGLCWPYMFSSVLPVRWWMFLPFAIIGGLLRQQSLRRNWHLQVPLWVFLLVFLEYAIWGLTTNPLYDYGREKMLLFLGMAGLAFLASSRQAPLTTGLMQGMRWTLLASFVLGLIIVFHSRNIFLSTEEYGMAELHAAFSLVGFPLSMSMAIAGIIPGSLDPRKVFGAGMVLLLAAGVEVFIRGRFHAMLLCVLAALLVLGPPWRHLFWRVMLSGVLAVIGLGLYVNVVPLMGSSFDYLTSLNLETAGDRSYTINRAWDGFLAHPLGQGVGSFAIAEPFQFYPHNIVLESAYELGLPGLLAILAIYGVVLLRAWRLWLSPPHRVLAVLPVIVLLHQLKAGDLSTLAFQTVFLYQLVVATPVAKSWPLLRGRAIR